MIRGVARRGVYAAISIGRAVRRGAMWAQAFRRGRVVIAPCLAEASSLRFLAVGRQGYGNLRTGRIAGSMERTARESPTHGVLYLGDNFYPRGVASVHDSQWHHKFEWLYSGEHLRGMPFFAVIGNHDVEGNAGAQVQYSTQRCGSARWHMSARCCVRDFGRANGGALVRAVFLDTVAFQKDPTEQLAFLRNALDPRHSAIWRVVIGHYGCRSVTNEPYTRRLTLSSLLPELQVLRVDLYLSANDRFQQLLDRAGEPLHVSANGGGDKTEAGVRAENPDTDFVASQGGFAVVEFNESALSVELRNVRGEVCHRRRRER